MEYYLVGGKMNKKLLVIDIISFLLGLILFCIVQLMMSFNPQLLTNNIVLILFAIVLIVFGVCTMIISYKNNNEKVTISNLALHILLALVFYGFYSIPTLGFVDFYGLGFSILIVFMGLFTSRFVFSLSNYLKEHKTQKEIKTSTGVFFKTGYSRNIPDESHEKMSFLGYIVLIVSIIALFFNTFNPYFTFF